MSKLIILIILSLTPLFPLNALAQDKMAIAVIGDGIAEDRNQIELKFDCKTKVKNKKPKVNEKKIGQAMWDGVRLALKCSNREEFKKIRKFITLEPYNDSRNIPEAERIAKKIVKNPNLLAVIGHTSSGTTKATVRTYANSGIPNLTPASSPWVMHPEQNDDDPNQTEDLAPMENVFRILPGDELAQAPAIAFKSRKLDMDKVLILREITDTAKAYSKPLCDQIGNILEKFEVTVQTKELSDHAEIIDINLKRIIPKQLETTLKEFEPTGIIYCGYGKVAKKLMKKLRKIYNSSSSLTKPPIIFSEGISDTPITKEDFGVFKKGFKEVYMAYPFSEIDEQEIQSVKKKKKIDDETDIDFLRKFNPENLEVMGYDSMLILANAITECDKNEKIISRACLIKKLKTVDFVGVIDSYYFVNGENKLPSYNIYIFNEKANKFVSEDKINAGDLSLTLKRINQ